MHRQTALAAVVALLCAGVILLAGCAPVAPVSQPGTAAAGGERIAHQAAESTTFSDLDPASACVTQPWLLGNVYETLTRYNLPGAEPFIVPGLATEWSVAEDGMTWTFKLREGVKFHDGSDFDAEAVKFTVERNQDAQSMQRLHLQRGGNHRDADPHTSSSISLNRRPWTRSWPVSTTPGSQARR